MIRKCLIWSILILTSFSVSAFELEAKLITGNIYALVGEVGPRTSENHALNNTMGFVVTGEGCVLVSSGASPSGAKLIEQAIRQITDQPVRWVINIGVQDHHWLGNSYFVGKGAEVLALKRTVSTQKKHVEDHLARLNRVMGDRAENVVPVYATKAFDTDHGSVTLGGVDFELIWPGDGHFPGDAVLWLPKEQTVFTGDLVYNDRMLGIFPYSHVASWQKAFHKMASLNPVYVIAGHGNPGDLAKAKRDTGDYLDWLVTEVSSAVEEWQELGETVELLGEAPAFRHLKFYDSWHKRNINQTYVQMEGAR